MADLDQAESWVQANPQHPQAEAVRAKIWAMRNPEDPRSQQIMTKIGSAAQQAQNPQTLPDSADKAAHPSQPVVPQDQPSDLATYLKKGLDTYSSGVRGLVKGASLGNLDPANLPGNMGKAFSGDHPVAEMGGQLAGGLATGVMTGNAAGSLGPQGVGLLSSAGRVAMNTGAGALQGFLTKPGADGSRLHQAKIGAMIAGPISAAAEGYGALAGAGSDRLMKQAVGIKKDISSAEQTSINPETGELDSSMRGVGNKLIDMGVRGTRGQMLNQVGEKMASEEKNLQSLTDQLSGVIQPDEIADAISQHAQKFTLPSTGKTNPFTEGDLSKVRDLSDKVRGLGPMTPSDLLSLKRGAGYAGYTASGNPATSTDAMLAQTGASASRRLLGLQDPKIIDSLGNEQALTLADKALSKPGSVPSNTLTGLLFHKVPSLFGSYGATALQGSGEAASSPAVQQGALGALLRRISENE